MTRLLAGAGPLAPVLVFVLAAAESAAFLGIFVPGETVVILGGVAAGTGRVPLWLMVVAAVAGAVAGDSIGYRLGRRGSSIVARKALGRVAHHLDRAAAFLSERGWWALVVARFASVLRAVVPFAAGMAGMPYRTFLLGNVIGGVAWGTTFTLVGYAAGANYPRIERWFRTGGLAVAGLAATVGVIAWGTRWAQANRARLTRWYEGLSAARPVDALLRALSTRGRTTLAVTGVAIIAGAWLLGGLVQDVLGSEEFFFFDIAATGYLADHPVTGLVVFARAVVAATSPLVVLGATAVATTTAAFRRKGRPASALVLAVGGQWLIVAVIEVLVRRSPPAVTPLVPRIGYGFPSEHVALVVAVAFVAAWPWNPRGWAVTVRRYGGAVLLAALVGAARLVLLLDYPSDALAAFAAAGSWALVVCLGVAGPPSPRRRRADGAPSPPSPAPPNFSYRRSGNTIGGSPSGENR